MDERDLIRHKLEQLCIMREVEQGQPEPEQYGAHLTHWSGKAKPINLDAKAIQVLIEHFQNRSLIE